MKSGSDELFGIWGETMAVYSTETVHSPGDLRNHTDGAVLYRVSNLVTRAIIGILGALLPIIFIAGEAFFLKGGVHVRGSISAYYHTSMRDIFVAGLCVIGFFLATYLAGEPRTKDFWLSLVAGAAVIFVVFFPTMRPNLLDNAPRCGVTPMPDGCSPIQQTFHEGPVATVHFLSAAIFIISLGFLCFEFAKRENDRKGNARMARIVRSCGWIIFAAVGLVAVGAVWKFTIFGLTPLYVAEVASVWAFAAAWLIKARDLRLAFGSSRPPTPTPGQRDRRPRASID